MNFRVLIVRLSPFPETIKSVTHQFLYGECRRVLADEDIDFAFFPSESECKHKAPLCGSKTKIPAKDFNLILIVNSFTSELLNLPYLLKLADIPYASSARRTTSLPNNYPLIIMGGSNALAAQSILFNEYDALVDALYFGEGERNVEKIVRALSTSTTPWQALDTLQETVDGLKVFGADNACQNKTTIIHKAINNDTSTELLANAEQRLFDSPEATTARLFIAYGCPAFCTFCFEGWEHKPYREVPVTKLLQAAQELRAKTGTDTLEITAYNFNTYSDVTPLFRELNKLFFQVNFMSQRADILASHPELVSYEVASGKKQYTLGIEGISERMRLYYNKNLSEQTALVCLTQLLKQPIREIKLFYIISGLETQQDNDDYKQFLAKIASLKETYNNGIRILCSFGLLVRMPFTPLQYEKLLLTKEEWSPIIAMIRETTQNAGYEFRLTYPYEEYFLSQTLALYPPCKDNYLAPVLCEMAEHNFIYKQGIAPEAWDFFRSKINIDKSFVEEKDDTYHFAFNYLDCRTPKNVLYQRYRNSKQLFTSNNATSCETPLCLGAKCSGCNSCLPEQRTFLEQHKLTIPSEIDRTEIALLAKEKAQSQPVYIEVEINNVILNAGTSVPAPRAHQETKDAALMRTLFTVIPGATTLIMTVRDVLFGSKLFEGKLPHWYGKTIYAVFPFTNKMRAQLSDALTKAGYTVHNEQFIPDKISMELTTPSVPKDTPSIQKKLEKFAVTLLDDMHMQYTLSRSATATAIFSITSKSLKKHVVSSCSVESDSIKIIGSSKIDLSSISKNGFMLRTSF